MKDKLVLLIILVVLVAIVLFGLKTLKSTISSMSRDFSSVGSNESTKFLVPNQRLSAMLSQ